jgi:hypothetical protein
LVFGWYTSQLIHLKYKIYSRNNDEKYPPTLLSALHPYLNNVKKKSILDSASKIENIVNTFSPTVHLVTNDHSGGKKGRLSSASSSSSDPDSSNDLMGEVLNSIENKLGLAAIENGQIQDGVKLLR